MTLDENLTFDAHVKSVISKVSAKVFQLKKLRQYLTPKSALLIYKNMILPIIEYGDIYLYSASQENRKKLQTLQNKALRCALQKDKYYDTKALHNEAKLQKLKLRRKTHLLLHMYQISQLPNFKGWKSKPKINTRSSTKKRMKLSKPNLTKFQNSITYVGPKLWNALPRATQFMKTYAQFKDSVNAHLTPKGQVNR